MPHSDGLVKGFFRQKRKGEKISPNVLKARLIFEQYSMLTSSGGEAEERGVLFIVVEGATSR
jgi:hypothetical protein